MDADPTSVGTNFAKHLETRHERTQALLTELSNIEEHSARAARNDRGEYSKIPIVSAHCTVTVTVHCTAVSRDTDTDQWLTDCESLTLRPRNLKVDQSTRV